MVLKILVLTFCCTWFIWGCIILANQFGYIYYETPLNMVLFIIGCLAPAIVSVTFILKNKIMSANRLFRTLFGIKQSYVSYLLVMGFMILYVTAGVLSGAFTLFSPVYLLTFPIMIIGGGLEELCWRFILQPSLEKKLSFFIATSITSVIWTLWHLPLFFIEGRYQYIWNFGLYAIYLSGLAFALAAIYRLTKSVWLCVLFHALVNTLFEDSSFSINLYDFNNNVSAITITSAVLIIASCLAVTIATKIRKRNT